MNIQNLFTFIILIAPLAFIISALSSVFTSSQRTNLIKKLSLGSAFLSCLITVVSLFLISREKMIESHFIGLEGLGFSLRLDALTMIMFAMISLLSFIIIKYSLNYLEGDPKQGIFLGRLSFTLASVQLLVLSGNLAILFITWVLTSVSLHKLLLFYKDRPEAIIAAKKKFIVARVGDLALLAAFILLYLSFENGNLEFLFQEIKSGSTASLADKNLVSIGILLALAAMLKSAQFPSHGWLVEVMETPTPVSAILHAGLLNAGPFLIIRMAFIMEASFEGSLLLISIGTITALFGSIVFLTQNSIKTALAYSSIAHMGFSLLVCGLGIYPAALLHLTAHSFYKAHSFLSSGSTIEQIRQNKPNLLQRLGNPFRIALSILLAAAVYGLFAILWGIDPNQDFSLLALGAVLTLGLSRLFSTAIDSKSGIKLYLRACLLSILVTLSFFVLESTMSFLLTSQLPQLQSPETYERVAITLMLLLFSLTILLQIIAPRMELKPSYHKWFIHLRNGLYVNALFDRLIGALYIKPDSQKSAFKGLPVFSKKEETVNRMSLEEITA